MIGMAYNGDTSTLMKTAVFGLAMSLMLTLGLSIMLADDVDGDYDYDSIQGYRDELTDFTGESMLNSTPWVLTHVYTPYIDGDIEDHVTDDHWLYGKDITDYSVNSVAQIGKSADIRLDVSQKSSVPITIDNPITFKVIDGKKWYYEMGGTLGQAFTAIATLMGKDLYNSHTETAKVWDYTGYRYVFDPTLPFADDSGSSKTSVRDGSLSIVWYSYGGQEGLSGGLDVYGGDVHLASYAASDIIADYNSASSYASHYEFDFQGVVLDLYIRFDPDVIQSGTPLMQAWTEGKWSMAITSVSAGNFYDITGSTSFTSTAGSMIKTWKDIFTFSVPTIDNPIMSMLIWLAVNVPMLIAMLCVTLRLVEAAKPL